MAARCCLESACEVNVGFLYLTAGSLLNTLELFCSFFVLSLRHKRQHIPFPSTHTSHHIPVAEQYARDLSVSHSCLNLSFKDFWAFWSSTEIFWHKTAGHVNWWWRCEVSVSSKNSSSSSRVHPGCFGGCGTALGWGVSTSSTASAEQVVAADLDPVEHSESTAASGLKWTASVVVDASPSHMN